MRETFSKNYTQLSVICVEHHHYNLVLNTNDEFRIPLTKSQKKDDTILLTKSFITAKGLNIQYFGEEGTIYYEDEFDANLTPRPSTYLANTKDILLQKIMRIGFSERIPPLWAGRLWHFMPINKGLS